jgi:chemotaxis response regulator CheB
VVLDPEDAMFDGMPLSAIENDGVDHVVGLDDLGATLARLVREPHRRRDEEGQMEAEVAERETGT